MYVSSLFVLWMFVPTDVWSSRRFVPRDVLSFWLFCPSGCYAHGCYVSGCYVAGRFVFGRFVPPDVMSLDVLSGHREYSLIRRAANGIQIVQVSSYTKNNAEAGEQLVRMHHEQERRRAATANTDIRGQQM